MKTPAGKECTYFYGDYYRGREEEECRLLQSSVPPLIWNHELCFSCPVPEIEMANACKNMELVPAMKRGFPFGKKRVAVFTSCRKTDRNQFEPKVGCGECHQLPFSLPPEMTE